MQTVNIHEAAETKRVLDALNALIEACKDAEKGYATAAVDVQDARCRVLFEAWAKQRGQFVAALQDEVAQLGGIAENQGTLTGALRRGWNDLVTTLEGPADHAVLAACDRGEEAAIRRFEDALEGPLPPRVAILARAQLAAIRAARDEVRKLLGDPLPA